ncbi:TM0106 family RecB-like putative nuclease [Zafaria sp. Z1313]|uniref:TM0106 family RecB-like putative nuclease n=1 Tax=unclassified Zafaria TaxID=2828765 RepID=UPI002E77E07A|nr:TM0106 family RecB-like putative nuclease [Zafaria sp. J156]MEE1622297.1 TM0106 family RecB-like putative nuclease [Zafaria sp. J156]
MFLLDDPGRPEQSVILSASDLAIASECEFAALYRLDVLLKRRSKPDFPEDEMLKRAAALGDAHEQKVLAGFREQYGTWDADRGTGVREIERPEGGPSAAMHATLTAAREETLGVLRTGADVVFQAVFFDGAFLGYADFIVRQPDGRYAVWDSKLARHAKTTALLQLAAYGDQLLAEGLEPADEAVLVLGDLSRSVHPMPDLLPVFRERRDRLVALVEAHRASGNVVDWEQPGLAACGRCDYCAEEVQARRDLLLVAGMSLAQRKKLRAAGVCTIEQLAAMPAEQAKGPQVRLREQARLQTGLETGDGAAPDGSGLNYKVLPKHTIGRLPEPSPGDVFFDFEGDPLWQAEEDGSWGIEYLFGLVVHDSGAEEFIPFWAHDRAGEKKAFLDFVAFIEARRRTWPEMHVYHYAAYEKSALRNLSVRHTAAEDAIDGWLKEGLLVDLLDTVRHSLRISADSYSIKKLEPFYMTDGPRSGDVTNAGASVIAYAEYCAARDAGDAVKAQEVIDSIAAYNKDDCVSTLRLRDWLRGLGTEHPARGNGSDVVPSPGQDAPAPREQTEEEPDPAELRLRTYLDGLPADRPPTPDERAAAMVAAATGYHRRERKQYWWGHFDRLSENVETWEETRNVVMVRSADVVEDWAKATPRARTLTRTLRLRGTAAEGSDVGDNSQWFALYDAPVPEPLAGSEIRGGTFNATVIEAAPGAEEGTLELLLAERTRQGTEPYGEVPLALTPGKPIATRSIEESLTELARQVGTALPSLPRHAGLDVLRRRPPRLATLATLPPVGTSDDGGHDYAGAVTEAVADLDHSYLAVQGPPGTGKSHVGAHVIARLVARGWKIGVVSQGHAAVEGLLRSVIAAGVDPALVAKKPKPGDDAAKPWAHTDPAALEDLIVDGGGCVVGGTAWTMTGASVAPGSLDLLVIDEAGQYSLANTLAASRAARNLLLLGDPQQLPQVTQGKHPQPVDESALGWLSAGHATLPEEFGYFLADSWRMHPALCSKVSRLSYDGKLESAPAAAERFLAGVPAGVETVLVEHTGNTTSSAEEAAEVLRQVRRHLGLAWTESAGAVPRPLAEGDVLVVAPYNAQVALIREALDAAGLGGVRVGTVDKFQGQQAPVVIVSMACSAAAEAPRGQEFLFNRNRVNVAVSRGQWRAVVVRSPELTNALPGRPDALAELGAFIGLCSTMSG